MKVSVCVATRGTQDTMLEFYAGLAAHPVLAAWELIVVYNCAGFVESEALARARAALPAKTLVNPVPGKGNSLNLALEHAGGDLLVFTDDDIQPSPGWIDAFVSYANDHPHIPVFGGRTVSTARGPDWIERSYNLREGLLCEHDLGPVPVIYGHFHYPIGSNMAVRREAVERVGARWLPDIGPGQMLPVGDETAFLAQICPPGKPCRHYVANAVVHHSLNTTYTSLRGALQRCYQIGLSAGKLSRLYDVKSETGLIAHSKKRISLLRSGREFLCVCIRAWGYFLGRYAVSNGRT